MIIQGEFQKHLPDNLLVMQEGKGRISLRLCLDRRIRFISRLDFKFEFQIKFSNNKFEIMDLGKDLKLNL